MQEGTAKEKKGRKKDTCLQVNLSIIFKPVCNNTSHSDFGSQTHALFFFTLNYFWEMLLTRGLLVTWTWQSTCSTRWTLKDPEGHLPWRFAQSINNWLLIVVIFSCPCWLTMKTASAKMSRLHFYGNLSCVLGWQRHWSNPVTSHFLVEKKK